MDKISYALGLSMGQNLMGSGVEKLNYQDLAAGIEDVLTHAQPKISYQEAQQVLNTLATDTVRVHYEGTLIDGTVFDSSYKRGESISFPLNGVIKGWTEGLQLMSIGSKYKFFIPYQLAYGERGAGQSIPPYAALIFTVELLGIE